MLYDNESDNYFKIKDFETDINVFEFIPETIEILIIGELSDDINFKLSNLPRSLKKLEINNFKGNIKCGDLPKNLEYLEISFLDGKIEPNSLPENLKTLILDNNFNQPLKNILPSKLEILDLGYDFNRTIQKNDLPNSLLELTIWKYHYSKEIKSGVLPPKLKILSMRSYSYKFKIGMFPELLRELYVSELKKINLFYYINEKVCANFFSN